MSVNCPEVEALVCVENALTAETITLVNVLLAMRDATAHKVNVLTVASGKVLTVKFWVTDIISLQK